MKFLILIVIASAFLIGCSGDKEAPAAKTGTEMTSHEGHAHAEAGVEKVIYYTCPMESHKHIHSKEPGSCSECNMTLVPAVITTEAEKEFYGCPMVIHSHIRHDAPGRCEECKMELKPMRLKKTA